MKQLTSYNRVAGYLNKLFDLLNEQFFEFSLSRPTITIQSTPRAYGSFSLRDDTWISTLGSTHEINIGAGTLARPIEEVAATLLHEMVHYYCYENGISDTSRGHTYHNKRFKAAAEEHGLIVIHSDKYGWSHTSPSGSLIQFCLDNNLSDILLNRNEFYGYSVASPWVHDSITPPPSPAARTSHHRRYVCPNCGTIIRATKTVNVLCADCGGEKFVEK